MVTPQCLSHRKERREPGTDQRTTEVVDPVGHVQVIYLGPVAPHWECRMVFGDEEQIQAFVDRVDARLRFLPPHDPQFRRNRERVNRDAERENLSSSGTSATTKRSRPAASSSLARTTRRDR
jgi:hypothetical protein